MGILTRRYAAALMVLLLATSVQAQDPIVVVANAGEDVGDLDRLELRNLFMGGFSPYGLKPVVLPPQHPVRIVFNTEIIGLTESRIQSYWAQMRFSGRSRPPTQMASLEQLLGYLETTPGAVGYLPAGTELPPGLKEIYRSSP